MSIQYFDKYAIVFIDGNLSSKEDIKKFVYETDDAVENHIPNLIIDLKNTHDINSAGIAKILQLYKNQQALKSNLYMMNVGEDIESLLKDMMIYKLINKFKNEDEISF